jgi:cholesterol transport system auxiliary component
MKRRATLLAPLALTACGSLLPRQKYIPRINWPLDPSPAASLPSPATGPILLVRDLIAAPGFDQQGLQTLQPDGSIAVDFYNLWAAPPAQAVTQALITWCQASGEFSAVVSPGSRLTPNLILEGTLTELLADLGAGQGRAALTLVVIKPSIQLGATALPLAQVRLAGTAPISGQGAAAQATAQSSALANVLGQAVALVGRYA